MKIELAVSQDFFSQVMTLPESVRLQTDKFVKSFKRDPKAVGFNYERIENANPQLRSVRLNRGYRVILLAPKKGNHYVAMWADKHDEAYDWARRRRVEVHPDTGTLQVYSVVDSTDQHRRPAPSSDSTPALLFGKYRRRQLRRVGVPEELLDAVHALSDESDLAYLQNELPTEAYESLRYLVEGVPYAEVLELVLAQEEVDTDDVDAALERKGTRKQFVRVDDELLEEAFRGSLEAWRVFLHPEQRRLVEMHANGPYRVLGGAGTGKTVVAIHRAHWLAANVFTDPGDKILFLTYNTNLAADIRRSLGRICSEDVLSRIEVKNIDRWAMRMLYSQQYSFKATYQDKIATKKAWHEARVALPEDAAWSNAWLKDEYEAVVVQHGLRSLHDYLSISRAGRGTRLGHRQREVLWRMFSAYQEALEDLGLWEPEDVYREVAASIESGELEVSYRAVLVDEAQDMTPAGLRLIRSIAPQGPNDLFITGDPHQRIYGRPVVLSKCGIEIRGRSRTLRINYRTPEEVRSWATTVLKNESFDDLDGEAAQQLGYLSLLHGEPPAVRHFETQREEIDAILQHIKYLDCDDRLHIICLVTRTQDHAKPYVNGLKARGIETHRLSGKADDVTVPGVRIASMHRVKGLEYDHMIAAAVNAKTIPFMRYSSGIDQVARGHVHKRERSLLYVVATRAKKTLLVTGYGERCEFLPDA